MWKNVMCFVYNVHKLVCIIRSVQPIFSCCSFLLFMLILSCANIGQFFSCMYSILYSSKNRYGLQSVFAIVSTRTANNIMWRENINKVFFTFVWAFTVLAWLRSSRVVRASDCQSKVVTVLDSIPASSDTMKSEGRQMKQCWKVLYIQFKVLAYCIINYLEIT